MFLIARNSWKYFKTLVRLDLVWTSPTLEQTGPTYLFKLTLTCFIHGVHRAAEYLEKYCSLHADHPEK